MSKNGDSERKEVALGYQPVKQSMQAIVWKGPHKVVCEKRIKPHISKPEDVIVKVTYCSVCSGSDSHLYSGEIPTMEAGIILGHEACGIIQAVGDDVKKLNVGDHVVISFSIACGTCDFCKREEFTGCDKTNDSTQFKELYGGRPAGAIFGYSKLVGNIDGSQAEFVRVPYGDVNCYKIPPSVPEENALFVSDVLSTSLHATEMAQIGEGDSILIFGLGPIGLYCAAWARHKGASRIIGIDNVPERLTLAQKKFGVEAFDRQHFSSQELLKRLRGTVPLGGMDAVIDATGFRFSETWQHRIQRVTGRHSSTPEMLTECLQLVRKFGRVALIADYLGRVNHFPLGHVFQKNLTIRSGQCPVQKYFERVMEALEKGVIDPTLMVTHRIRLHQVPQAYERLFQKEQGYIKVLIEVSDPQDDSEEHHPAGLRPKQPIP
uniref:S(Hydroxymethyl)glutathione dehydrogenase putative n=1 Tax=Albugo laibachii Nc14 TaxID=890382 RepID=F0WX48_9STRA|nr:S(hydroxymethyl)glutathione dehydrogenase putative [Albugo laibachii Nc14]|eukprot:CCA26038.1 S(hydroxymethyl)glutathione dehydrogenase putative [Albugo laibachii Nc14]